MPPDVRRHGRISQPCLPVRIGDIVRLEFGKVRECLDVYHASEHLSHIGKLYSRERSSGEYVQEYGGIAIYADSIV